MPDCRFSSETGPPPLLLRQFDGDLCAAAPVTLNRERAAVKLGQSFSDSKAQAKTLLFLHFAIELHIGPNSGDLLGFEAAALVADSEDDRILRVGQSDSDFGAGTRELECILHELGHDLAQI